MGRTKKPRGAGAREDDWQPEWGRDDDGEGVEIRTRETAAGRVAIAVPASVRRLNGEQTEVLAEMQSRAVASARLRDEIDELASIARDLGLSWSVIGWGVGLTGEAARQRWADLERED